LDSEKAPRVVEVELEKHEQQKREETTNAVGHLEIERIAKSKGRSLLSGMPKKTVGRVAWWRVWPNRGDSNWGAKAKGDWANFKLLPLVCSVGSPNTASDTWCPLKGKTRCTQGEILRRIPQKGEWLVSTR
jgi:hypothetical protein